MKVKTGLLHFCILVIGLFVGFYIGTQYYPRIDTKTVTIEKEKPIYIEGKSTTDTKTRIAYVPKETIIERYIDAETGKEVTKESLEKTDLDATIGKTEFNVKLNGKDVQFRKSDDEQFIFDKNKVALNQTSTITFDATVSPMVIDNTKRWGVGIGYASNNGGVAYKLDFPIGNNNWGGWAYKDDDRKSGGLSLRF